MMRTSFPTEVRCERVSELLPDDAAFDAGFRTLPEWRRRKCEAFRFAADRRRSVAVWLLLRRMLAEAGIRVDDLRVVENAYGRPEFDPTLGVRFSLAHAQDRVMAAVSTAEIGCDVEKIAPLREGIAEACLTSDELASVRGFPVGPSRDREFCRLWTRKESCVKALGRGLSLDLKAFSVLTEDPVRVFRDFDFGDGYLGCVCVFGLNVI